MTTAVASTRFASLKPGSRRKSGFSLVEVVVATGLCTYALLVIACLLPMGTGTFQIANQNVVQSEIFNKIQLELNSTPYYQLPAYYRFSGGSTTRINGTTAGGTGLSYFNQEGEELPTATNAIYTVLCTLNTTSSQPTSPPVDGYGMSGSPGHAMAVGGAAGANGAQLAIVSVQIGFHFTPTVGSTDPRIATRSFVIAKRDTSNGS